MSTEKPPVWVSRKSCGCIVTVCASDRADAIAECHQEAQQRGLTMELITWQEWKDDGTFMNCTHEEES